MFRNLLIVFAAAVILGFGGSSQGTPTNLNVKSPGDDQRPQQVNIYYSIPSAIVLSLH